VWALLLTGHTSAHTWRSVLAPLLGLHVLIVAFWFGALWPLLLVIRLDTAAAAAQITARYSALASYLVPLIAVAGVAMAWILTGGPAIFQRPYGELLLLKLLVFALLMVLAAVNRWRLVPALAAPASSGRAGRALRRTVIAEFVLIAIVLTVTAALTTLYSPH
jgi:putative copper resistance protein D